MKVGYEEKNVTRNALDMDEFKLKKGEFARILIIDDEVETEFRHFYDVGGNKGYVICLGQFQAVMLETGSDPEHCPFCAKCDASKGAISQARQHFVTQLVRYTTNSRGDVVDPLSYMVQLWAFGSQKFNAVRRIKEQVENIHRIDLLIGPCVAELYQNYAIIACKEGLALRDTEVNRLVELYKQQTCPDIIRKLGRKMTHEDMLKVVVEAEGQPPVHESVSQNSVTNNAKPAASMETQEQSSNSQGVAGPVDVDELLKGIL